MGSYTELEYIPCPEVNFRVYNEFNYKITELSETKKLLEYKIDSFDEHIAQFKLGNISPNNIEKLWEFKNNQEEEKWKL